MSSATRFFSLILISFFFTSLYAMEIPGLYPKVEGQVAQFEKDLQPIDIQQLPEKLAQGIETYHQDVVTIFHSSTELNTSGLQTREAKLYYQNLLILDDTRADLLENMANLLIQAAQNNNLPLIQSLLPLRPHIEKSQIYLKRSSVLSTILEKASKGESVDENELSSLDGAADKQKAGEKAKNSDAEIEELKAKRKQAEEHLLQQAKNGDADAQYELGSYYLDNQWMQQDYPEAMEWLEKAAKQEHLDAMYEVGLIYHKGLGVESNRDQAVEWLTKAGLEGHDKARRQLLSMGIKLPTPLWRYWPYPILLIGLLFGVYNNANKRDKLNTVKRDVKQLQDDKEMEYEEKRATIIELLRKRRFALDTDQTRDEELVVERKKTRLELPCIPAGAVGILLEGGFWPLPIILIVAYLIYFRYRVPVEKLVVHLPKFSS